MKINEGWMKIEDQIDMSSAVGLPDVLNRRRSIPPRKIRRNTKRPEDQLPEQGDVAGHREFFSKQ